MRNPINAALTLAAFLAGMLMLSSENTFAQSYKCKGADGKIEYSDRPCAVDKDVLAKPASASNSVAGKPVNTSMVQLGTLFVDFEDRLCEREKLSIEIDKAQRSGDLQKSDTTWKPKQERINFLNDTLIEFQAKASKIISASKPDGDEPAALRKYQRRLKDCDKAKPSAFMFNDKPVESKPSEAKTNDGKAAAKPTDAKAVEPKASDVKTSK